MCSVTSCLTLSVFCYILSVSKCGSMLYLLKDAACVLHIYISVTYIYFILLRVLSLCTIYVYYIYRLYFESCSTSCLCDIVNQIKLILIKLIIVIIIISSKMTSDSVTYCRQVISHVWDHVQWKV